MIRKRQAHQVTVEVSKLPPFTLGNAAARLLKVGWDPSHHPPIPAPFGELYALAHTVPRNDGFRGPENA